MWRLSSQNHSFFFFFVTGLKRQYTWKNESWVHYGSGLCDLKALFDVETRLWRSLIWLLPCIRANMEPAEDPLHNAFSSAKKLLSVASTSAARLWQLQTPLRGFTQTDWSRGTRGMHLWGLEGKQKLKMETNPLINCKDECVFVCNRCGPEVIHR